MRALLTELFCARFESLCGETESMSLNTKRLRVCHAHSRTVLYSNESVSLRGNWKYEFKYKDACVPCSQPNCFVLTRLNQFLCGETESMSTTKLHACRGHSTVLCSNCFAATETESMSLNARLRACRAHRTVLWSNLFAAKLKAWV